MNHPSKSINNSIVPHHSRFNRSLPSIIHCEQVSDQYDLIAPREGCEPRRTEARNQQTRVIDQYPISRSYCLASRIAEASPHFVMACLELYRVTVEENSKSGMTIVIAIVSLLLER